jgi:hypothetical protein
MAKLFKSFLKLLARSCLVLTLSGCAMLPFAVPAAISGGAAGVNYSFTNVAYKTISYPVADVDTALHKALIKMRITEVRRKSQGGTVSVTAATSQLDIFIDLEKITPSVTNIKVNAKRGAFFKDKATATEIIVQIENILEVKD